MFTTQIMDGHRGLPDRDPLHDLRHRLHVRIIHGMPGRLRVRLPARSDNAELIGRIERALGERSMLSRIRGNATTGSLVLEFTGVYEDVLARLAAQLPPGPELSCSK